MESAVEKEWVTAQKVIEIAKRSPRISRRKISSGSKWKSLNEKLIDLYLEECQKDPKFKNFSTTSFLIEKLVRRDKLNCLVLNLYPGNNGYSLMLKSRNDVHSETLRLPYEENELLQYIDNKELPPILVDLLEQAEVNLFHCGCVIVEVRDYRRSLASKYSTQYVLLKPTNQTLFADLNAITNDGQHWTYEEKQQLESSLLLATQEPLCLDPSVSVTFVANQLQHEEAILSNPLIKKNMKKYNQPSVNRRKRLNQLPAPSNLKLHDFIKKRASKIKNKKSHRQQHVDTWLTKDAKLVFPSGSQLPNVPVPEQPKSASDATLSLVEKYILEAERKEGKIYHTKLTVHQRNVDDVYLGTLYVDRDYVEGQSNGATCQFALGNKTQVAKYINQFKEIFTEEGRKAVRITHIVPGQQPKTSITPGMRERNTTTNVTDVCSDSVSEAEKKTQQMQNDQAAIAITSTLLNIASNTADVASNLGANKLFTNNNKCLVKQLTSSNTVGRARAEANTKFAQPISLPSYSQALSGSINTALRATPVMKVSVSEAHTVGNSSVTSIGDKQTIMGLSNDIIVKSPSTTCQNIVPNVSLANLPISQNISLQNIARVPHLQVSLTAVPQGLAVPISISMVDPSQQATGVIVSSTASSIVGGTSSNTSSLSKQSVTIASSSPLAQTMMVTSSVVNTQPSIIAAPASMLSLPVGVASNINAQLMTTNLKSGPSGFRTSGGGLSLLQVSGHQHIPLFNQVQSPVIATTNKPIVSGASANVVDQSSVQQPLITLTPQQQHLQFALQKQQFQQIPQLQIQQSSSKTKAQKRPLLKPHK